MLVYSDSGLYFYKNFLQTCEKCLHSNGNETKILTQNGLLPPGSLPIQLDTDLQIT